MIREFEEFHAEADQQISRLNGGRGRYLALLKACLIGADVGRLDRPKEGRRCPSGSVRRSPVSRVLISCGEIVAKKLGGRSLRQFQTR